MTKIIYYYHLSGFILGFVANIVDLYQSASSEAGYLRSTLISMKLILHGMVDDSDLFSKIASDGNFYLLLEKTTIQSLCTKKYVH